MDRQFYTLPLISTGRVLAADRLQHLFAWALHLTRRIAAHALGERELFDRHLDAEVPVLSTVGDTEPARLDDTENGVAVRAAGVGQKLGSRG